jgi:transcriptional regulator with XRE-family HTH domain
MGQHDSSGREERRMMAGDGIGALLRRLREEAGLTREEQAGLIEEAQGGRYFDPQNLKRWERESRLPERYWHPVLSSAYGLPAEEIARAVGASRRRRRLDRLTPDLYDPHDGVDPVERRSFLGAAALAAGAAAEPWGRLAAALTNSRVDPQLAADLEHRTADQFTAEETTPARLLAARLAAHLDTLAALLPRAGQHRTALTIAAGETAALAGWVAWDSGHEQAARYYWETAALAGRQAGHGPVNALVLGYASYTAPPERARAMLTAAQQHVRGPGYATARAWLAAREAEEAAALGDRESAVRAIDRAATALDYASPGGEQAWTAFFGRPRLGSMTVRAYGALGHPELEAVATEVLGNLGGDDRKVNAVVLADVAAAYVQAGHLDRGAAVARQALAATRQGEASLGRQRLSELASHLPTGDPSACALRDELHAALR